MRTILFTKKDLDKKWVSKTLDKNFKADFTEVLKIEPLEMCPFHLKDKSLIFTSIYAVEAFFKNGFSAGENYTEKNFNKIYAVGKKSKKALQKGGLGTFKVKKNAQELGNFLVQHTDQEQFLHFCGNIALDTLEKKLRAEKMNYEKVVLYTTSLKYPVVKNTFSDIVFFSPSGVRSFLKFNSVAGKKIFSIGKTTTAEIEKYTEEKIYTSEESTLEDLLRLINSKL